MGPPRTPEEVNCAPKIDDRHAELPVDPDPPELGARPLHLLPGAMGLVAFGGFVGTMARYGLEVVAPARSAAWPWGTFAANMVGAFVLGVLVAWLARSGTDRGRRRRQARLLGVTGFCGGLTTYSTFAVEADLLIRDHAPGLASTYLAVTLVAGLAATALGVAAATGHHRRRQQRRQA